MGEGDIQETLAQPAAKAAVGGRPSFGQLRQARTEATKATIQERRLLARISDAARARLILAHDQVVTLTGLAAPLATKALFAYTGTAHSIYASTIVAGGMFLVSRRAGDLVLTDGVSRMTEMIKREASDPAEMERLRGVVIERMDERLQAERPTLSSLDELSQLPAATPSPGALSRDH